MIPHGSRTGVSPNMKTFSHAPKYYRTRVLQGFSLLFVLLLTTCSLLGAGANERIREGVLVSYDPHRESIALRQANGLTYCYHVTEQTLYRKDWQPALAQDFATGEKVLLTVRLKRDGTAFEALGLFDPASYRHLQQLAEEPTKIVITEVSAGGITGSLALPQPALEAEPSVHYLCDRKTHWIREGKEGSEREFQAGQEVWVSPKGIIGGEVVANAIADKKESLLTAYRVPAINVRGRLISYLPSNGTLQLRTLDGENHTYSFTSPPELLQRAKSISQETLLAAIPNRFPVCVRLFRTPSSEFVIRITIEKTERHRRLR